MVEVSILHFWYVFTLACRSWAEGSKKTFASDTTLTVVMDACLQGSLWPSIVGPVGLVVHRCCLCSWDWAILLSLCQSIGIFDLLWSGKACTGRNHCRRTEQFVPYSRSHLPVSVCLIITSQMILFFSITINQICPVVVFHDFFCNIIVKILILRLFLFLNINLLPC